MQINEEYRKLIIKMVSNIKNPQVLIRIYTFILVKYEKIGKEPEDL